MPLTGSNEAFLKKCFEADEWEYLKNLPKFAALLAAAKDTLEDAEQLCLIGGHLVAEWEDLKKGEM